MPLIWRDAFDMARGLIRPFDYKIGIQYDFSANIVIGGPRSRMMEPVLGEGYEPAPNIYRAEPINQRTKRSLLLLFHLLLPPSPLSARSTMRSYHPQRHNIILE